jgi:HNH endonuclease/helix-turn-helix, Psq domain
MPEHYTREMAAAAERARARFWAKLDRSGDCWLWTGECRPNGYGRLRVGAQTMSAHRFAYETSAGPIPAGLQVLHRCDVKRCCRPDHLYVGTQLDNMRDKVERGRWRGGRPKGSRNGPGAHPSAILTRELAEAIRAEYVPRRVSQYKLAAKYGVSRSTIEGVVLGIRWRP